jgi:Ni/Fe-hydrogenase subunit HybB-like protein
MATLSRFNPFPLAVWIMLALFFIAGYFTGGVVTSFAIQENHNKTLKFIKGYEKSK